MKKRAGVSRSFFVILLRARQIRPALPGAAPLWGAQSKSSTTFSACLVRTSSSTSSICSALRT